MIRAALIITRSAENRTLTVGLTQVLRTSEVGALYGQIMAGVLMFRALTYGAQIPLGVITYVIWQRKRSWRKPVPAPEPELVAAAAPPAT